MTEDVSTKIVSIRLFTFVPVSWKSRNEGNIRYCMRPVDLGVILFDPAIIYGPLTNEELIGEALSALMDRLL